MGLKTKIFYNSFIGNIMHKPDSEILRRPEFVSGKASNGSSFSDNVYAANI